MAGIRYIVISNGVIACSLAGLSAVGAAASASALAVAANRGKGCLSMGSVSNILMSVLTAFSE